MPQVDLMHIYKSFGNTQVLQDVSISVKDGEFFTLLGPSGCGKTTTLRLIAGFSFPDSGAIMLDGKDVSKLPPEKRNFGMVFQNYALFPHLSVGENIAFGLKMRHMSKDDIRRRIEAYLHLVKLDAYEGRQISQLSGGQQQRVALARALATEPSILLLDEPLSNLDAKLRDEMRIELRRIQKELGITTLYVTHDQAEALSMSDRIAVFEKGRCSQTANPEDLYNSPASTSIASFIGSTNLVPCSILAEDKTTARISALGCEIEIPLHIALDPKNDYSLSIRPEAISFCDPDRALCSGIFTDAVFNGATIRAEVKVGGTMLHISMLNDATVPLPEKGSSIGISFKQAGIRLVPKKQESDYEA